MDAFVDVTTVDETTPKKRDTVLSTSSSLLSYMVLNDLNKEEVVIESPLIVMAHESLSLNKIVIIDNQNIKQNVQVQEPNQEPNETPEQI